MLANRNSATTNPTTATFFLSGMKELIVATTRMQLSSATPNTRDQRCLEALVAVGSSIRMMAPDMAAQIISRKQTADASPGGRTDALLMPDEIRFIAHFKKRCS